MAHFHVNFRAQSLLGRLLLATAALALVVLLVFFLAAAIVVGTVVAVAIITRLWWLKRRLGRGPQPGVISAEYTVVEREPPVPLELPLEASPDAVDEAQGTTGSSLSAPGPGSGNPGSRSGGS
jgi:hypothetical protein